MENKEPLSEGITHIVKCLTRPALTFFGLVSWVMLFANYYDIPEYFTVLVFGMVSWWFGDRSYFKLKSLSKNKEK